MISRSLFSWLLAACLTVSALAGSHPALAAGETDANKDPARLEAVRKLVQERLGRSGSGDDGSVKVVSVRQTPYLGLFEVVTEDRKLLYTDEKVNYLVAGRIYDMKSLKDLTADRLEEISAIKFDTLPLDLAIKVVKGNGKRKMAVFSDSDCPFCKKLETELEGITDITVYTFLFPIQQLHPNAPEHTRRIWCAADREKAWKDYWNRNALPEPRECDTTGLDKILKLGHANHIEATPTLIFADGHVVPGAMPAAQLERQLNQAALR